MQTIRDVASLREAVDALRATGRVALVPTMGALHAGHISLVDAARAQAEHVAVSIFVNPTQFGANEDLDAYPRREAADAAMLEDAGVAVLWAPAVAEMYPDGFATTVSVAGLGDDLCGASRPGHFDGVASVVAKLLNQVRPDVAVFGEKDWQQLAVIRRMAADLDLPVRIVGVPIARDADGLAMSSRNAYLSADERARARALPDAMRDAASAIARGADVAQVVAEARATLERAGFVHEYLELRDATTLGPVRSGHSVRLLVAARLGTTRLIDNMAVGGT